MELSYALWDHGGRRTRPTDGPDGIGARARNPRHGKGVKTYTTRIPPAVYGQAVTHTAPSRAGMVQTLLCQPPEPQSRPTTVDSMSSRAGDKQRVTLTDFARSL